MITSSFHHCVYKRTGTPAGVKESILPDTQPSHQIEHRHFSEVSPPHTSPDSLFFYSPPPPTHTPSKNQRKKPSQTDAVAQSEPYKQKRCAICPAKRDRKVKICCSKRDSHIYKDYTVLMGTGCSK
ncbi:hypothetical protein PoB_003523600 [Plakobranchus ocellatus]|uniref:Uncharacterized protein n=1 Tax=Plakobranchus ocellatus TaxID=259542 RepID=A0AAV4AQ66_9GAST|nr:hypothetical protein PoB_003523600 [Plakobranchus ocellatus]